MSYERQTFRIVYPLSARARLLVAGRELPVIDCSENGLRLEIAGTADDLVDADGLLRGRLELAQGASVEIVGKPLRVEQASLALLLEEQSRIPIALIYQEQRHLRARYPEWR